MVKTFNFITWIKNSILKSYCINYLLKVSLIFKKKKTNIYILNTYNLRI